jgi:endonuclease YncB( thermonuclease family)
MVALALVLTAFVAKRASFFAHGNEFPAEALVKEVIDGDTVILKQGQKVRYLGINAPEIRAWDGKRWVLKRQLLGEEAKTLNERLVEGKRISLEYDRKKRDRYERLLAYVRVDEVFVNEAMVRDGLALMDVRAPNLKHQEVFLNAQKEARRFSRGIWKKIGDNTITHREAVRFVNRIGAVQGKIRDVHRGKRKAYLNFGRDYKTDFTGVIYEENLKNFPLETGGVAAYFLGKRVRIYGFIKEGGGPMITICAPSQIDFLN